MSLAKQNLPSYTVDDYRHWQGDWELWDGVAIAMTPGPYGKHQKVLFELAAEMRDAIKAAGCRAEVLGELDWIVNSNTVVRPDLIVLCGQVPEQHLTNPPELIAEILSPSTRFNDLGYKKELYRQSGVKTYLVVDTDSPSITHWQLDESGNYELLEVAESLHLSICEKCNLKIEICRFL